VLSPADLERLRAAHIYDPTAEDAAEQLALLERLEARGLGPDDLLTADRLGTLVMAGFEHLIRPGRRQTTAEVAAATGLATDELRRWWRAWGFPDPAPDEACWTDGDVDAIRFLREAEAFAGDDWSMAIARAAGTAMSRVAESEVAFVRSRVEAPLLQQHAARATMLLQYERVIAAFLPAAEKLLDTVHRHHLTDFRRRYATAQRPSANNVLDVVVGFADVTGSTALVEHLHLAELDHALAVFDERTTDAIARAGATLVKRLGDGVMFVTDNADTACHLALDVVDAFPEAEDLPPVRVGLAAGDVAAMRGDYFGPAVHRAARVVAVAPPRTVLVAAEVAARVTSSTLVFESIGGRALAGFDRPVELLQCRRASER
jgi:class 3 adenylate cyclase